MKKAVVQLIVILLLFFGVWFILSQIDWVKIFKVQKVTDNMEQKLGELFWEVFQKTGDVNKNTYVIDSVDSLVTHICKANHIDRESIKIYVLNVDEVNAFALPDGYLVLYSGLILNADSYEQLAGVICHEIAHIELNHVMKKLVKEVGLSVLISMTTGNTGTNVIRETVRMLSSSAFDRRLEKEADIKAVEYLIKARINPEPFANFLYKLAEKQHEAEKYLTWISTHPDPKERAIYVVEHSEGKTVNPQPVLSNTTWNKLKTKLKIKPQTAKQGVEPICD